jgi:hypothetical protein
MVQALHMMAGCGELVGGLPRCCCHLEVEPLEFAMAESAGGSNTAKTMSDSDLSRGRVVTVRGGLLPDGGVMKLLSVMMSRG